MADRVKIILISMIFFFFMYYLSVPVQAATTYYVSSSGSDTNSGAQASPWATLQKAADTIVAGDTLYLRGGTYLIQGMAWFTSNGTSDKPITISGYPGEKVILDGQRTAPSGSGSYVIAVNGNWYTVKDLEIANSGAGGVSSGGTNVTIQNLDIHHCQGSAIILTGDYDLAQNNQAWSNSLVNENNKSGITGGWGSGISCARYPQHCTIKGNTVYDTWGEGISTFEATYTTVEDNVSYNNQLNFYPSDTKYSVFQRNLGYCTPGNVIGVVFNQIDWSQNGMYVGDEKGVPMVNGVIDPTGNGTRYPSSDNKILNNFIMGCDRNIAIGSKDNTLIAYNTFVNSGGNASERANVLIYAAGTCTNCRFINNLILQENSNPITIGGGVNTGWTFSNNLWSTSPGTNFSGSNDIIANPNLAKTGLIDPGQLTADYFKILSTSSAINKAMVLSEVTEDHFKTQRGANPDIGGYEFNTVSSSPTPVPTTTIIPTPTLKPACKSDINNDKTVNLGDITQILGKWGQSCSGCKEDTVADGVVNLADLSFILQYWGQSCN
jgi:hypothetical protein